jgi:hypothetical protein
MSQGGVPDPNVRASDADRERIVEQLRQHTAEGRLTMDEFDQRMSAAYAAKTYGDLAQLTRDLPVDLGARSWGAGAAPSWKQTPSWKQSPTSTAGTAGPAPSDVVGALVGAAMDWKLQSRQVRDQLRAQRHQQRLARRHSAPVIVAAVAGWASLSVLLTGVWFISGLADSNGFGEFWPIWPIGITGLLILARTVKGTIIRRTVTRR